MAEEADHLISLGGTRWRLWRESVLRGAGFPADRFTGICDDELAAAADLLDNTVPATHEQYTKVFAAAADRLAAAIRHTAGESALREAVTWQNPGLVRAAWTGLRPASRVTPAAGATSRRSPTTCSATASRTTRSAFSGRSDGRESARRTRASRRWRGRNYSPAARRISRVGR
ncbi:hypothetical protein Psuf_065430 [Phytohabitans suffuscus]|uniref:Uncharacterized protein n=1 Tax=Phytohabitans suffuscus TaxID=624315 RepID=A0A6F8YSV4_9ACTN|nr:hypothetical protein Psuf_065430 [Phytohabitans suffuscus]